MKKFSPIHPGEILKEDYLVPLGLSATAFAKVISVPPNRITRIINGTTSVTADTALLLGKALRTSPEFWINLQARYDLLTAQDKSGSLKHIKPVVAA